MRRLAPLGLAGVLLACGGGSDTPEAREPAEPAAGATDAPDATDAPAAPAEQGDPAAGGVVAAAPSALQFTAPLLGGGDIEMASLAGRPVLLWFWAPW